MKKLLSFPSEIIDIICLYLSGKDLCTCLCVSSAWHDVFIHYLYRNITIRGEDQLQQVCRNLLHHAPRYLGHSVRTINLRLKVITTRHLSQLSAWCPGVENIILRWSVWEEKQSPTPPTDAPAREEYPAIMASFIGPFMNLSHLSLDLYFGWQGINVLDFLPFLPHLAFLDITIGNQLSLEYIEYISKRCPSLQQLSLQCTFIEKLPPIFSISPSSTLPVTGTMSIKPADHLRKIELEYYYGDYEYYLDWLMYFSKKYPNLTSFEFHQYGSMRLPTSIPSTTPIQLEHRIDDDVYHHVFSCLSKQCPYLSSVYWRNIIIHPSFFSIVGPQLDHISVRLPENDPSHPILQPPFNSPYVSRLFQHQGLRQHLTSLEISPPMHQSNDPHFSQHFLDILGQLCHLSALTIHWKHQLTGFCLDALLQTFPLLIRLDLISMKLSLSQQETPDDDNDGDDEDGVDAEHSKRRLSTLCKRSYRQERQEQQRRYPLQSLGLRGVSLIDSHVIFSWINTHLRISHLSMTHSCRFFSSSTSQYTSCNIWLPDTSLITCSIRERSHQVKPIRLYMLHQTQQAVSDVGTSVGRRSTATIHPADNHNSNDFGSNDYFARFSHLLQPNNSLLDKHAWYFLKTFDNENMSANEWVSLDTSRNFEWAVPCFSVQSTCPWYADFCDAADKVYMDRQLTHDKVDDVYGIEYVNIVCKYIGCLKINDNRIPFV